MERKRYRSCTTRKLTSRSPTCSGDAWEETAFSDDALGLLGDCVWPPRSYSCSFCKREFRSAQALGGHMNVHRRDRARLIECTPPQTSTQNNSQQLRLQFCPNSPPQVSLQTSWKGNWASRKSHVTAPDNFSCSRYLHLRSSLNLTEGEEEGTTSGHKRVMAHAAALPFVGYDVPCKLSRHEGGVVVSAGDEIDLELRLGISRKVRYDVSDNIKS